MPKGGIQPYSANHEGPVVELRGAISGPLCEKCKTEKKEGGEREEGSTFLTKTFNSKNKCSF